MKLILEQLKAIQETQIVILEALKILLEDSIRKDEKELEEGKGMFADLDDVVHEYFASLNKEMKHGKK